VLLGREQRETPGDFCAENAIRSQIGTRDAWETESVRRDLNCEGNGWVWDFWEELAIGRDQQSLVPEDLPYRS
jgi:superoxide dismutase